MNAALLFEGVTKSYGRRKALQGLDLRVPAGTVFGLVGSNGAGKTTAMAAAVGLLHTSGGRIDLLGDGPFDAHRHAGRVTLLPQDSRFPPHAPVAELLTFYGRLQGCAAATLPAEIDALLDWVHLTDRRRSPIRTLSHGMGRRVAIAQAFLGQPELVLLDEPLSGLDPREAARIRELIRARRGRQTIVISSHVLTDLEALCDDVAFMEAGRLVRQDRLDTITRRSHTVTYRLTGEPPVDALQAALPGATVAFAKADGRLEISDGAGQAVDRLNAQVLRILLDAGVGVLEIRRGSDLEQVYFQSVPAPAAPGAPPALPSLP